MVAAKKRASKGSGKHGGDMGRGLQAKGSTPVVCGLPVSRWYLALGLLALLLSAVVISPMLHSGFFGDDAVQSTTFARSALRVEDTSLFAQTYEIIQSSVRAGRFFPFSTLTLWPFYLADNMAAGFKVYVFLLVLANIALFAYFVRLLSGSWELAILSELVVPVLFQFRSSSFHDPILGFSAHLQVTMSLLLISLIMLTYYLRNGSRRALLVSCIFYAFALLTYEVMIPFFLVHLAIIWLYPKRHPFVWSLKKAAPFIALAAALVVISIAVRVSFGDAIVGSEAQYATKAAVGQGAQSAYAMNLNPGPALRTVAEQIVAALPFSYQLLDRSAQSRQLFPGFGFGTPATPLVSLFLMAGFAVVVAMSLRLAWSRQPSGDLPTRLPAMAAVGVGMLLLPTVLISLSPKYQSEVYWGVGYLPVYISYFGVALLICTGLAALMSLVRRRLTGVSLYVAIGVAAALLLGFASVADYQNNRVDVEYWNRGAWYPRTIMTTAMQRGLFEGVPAGARVVVSGYTPWDSKAFYDGLSGRPVKDVVSNTATDTVAVLTKSAARSDSPSGTVYTFPQDSNQYVVAHMAGWIGNGYALVGRMTRLTIDSDGVRTATLQSVRVYAGATPLPKSEVVLQVWKLGTGVAQPTPQALGIDPRSSRSVSSGTDWALFETDSLDLQL